MKKIVLWIFLVVGQLSHASNQIEETKTEEPIPHRVFIKEIVTDIVDYIMNDNSSIIINMKTYRDLVGRGLERDDLVGFNHGIIREYTEELDLKDLMFFCSISELCTTMQKNYEISLHDNQYLLSALLLYSAPNVEVEMVEKRIQQIKRDIFQIDNETKRHVFMRQKEKQYFDYAQQLTKYKN